MKNIDKLIKGRLLESVTVHQKLVELSPLIEKVSRKLCEIIDSNGILYLFGNGGSAADAQHIAAELNGTFYNRKRSPVAASALTTNSSNLTAIANDVGFENVFKRQVEALVKRGDAVMAISTSGRSKNVLKAVKSARKIGAYTIGFTGQNGTSLSRNCHDSIVIPSADVARIQECHILIGHIICEVIEKAVA
ncbi:MAG: SIS domain-containing protein [Planctomycetes bacterium]|nr:SIS domain-containing protein [Planctomycetota bacterium]